MPDLNKLQALTDVGFVVRRTCLRCIHFHKGAGAWGTCAITPYEHLKHTNGESPRRASVPVDGSCSRHEFGPDRQTLGAHTQFIEPESGE